MSADHHGGTAVPSVARLRCEAAVDPLGIGTATPRLSWHVDHVTRGQDVTAYQVLVASGAGLLAAGNGDLWDSGRVAVERKPAGVDYAGTPLVSRQRCWWTVRVWDRDGQASDYAAPGCFELGLLSADDWQATWTGHVGSAAAGALYLRRGFTVEGRVEQARLHISGLGWYHAFLNGERIGDHELDPGVTDTSRRVLATTYDVTTMIVAGDNMLGVALGHGWSGTRQVLAQLEITRADGTVQTVVSDASAWQALAGPIVEDSIYDGETYDARLANPDWCRPGTTDVAPMRDLQAAMGVNPPGGVVEPQGLEPIKIVETREVVARTEPAPGISVFDGGQNLAGWAKITVTGPRGATVRLRFAEVLGDDGLINADINRAARATDTYVLAGGGEQTWEPSFTFHGFRYVQVETEAPDGDDERGRPQVSVLQIRVVRSAMERAARFHCSDPLLNAISEAVYWTEASNVHAHPTDCPQRNERMAWLNDLAARSEELVQTFDVARFVPKWLRDIADTQDAAGAITDTAPYRFGARPADPVSVCFALLPELMHRHYGDERVAAQHVDAVAGWQRYLASRAVDDIVDYSYYGDWAPPLTASEEAQHSGSAVSFHTPGRLVSTAMFCFTTRLLARMARIAGRPEAATWEADASRIARRFNEEYWDAEHRWYGTGSQACNAIALYLGLVPADRTADTFAALVADVEAHDRHLTTGNICSKYLLEVLSEHGRHDLALALATQRTYPSWGYMIDNGATTIWERWEREIGGGMNSHNHPMYGSIGAWLYRWVGGIRVADDAVGFSQVIIEPRPSESLTSATVELTTPHGPLSVAWSVEAGRLDVRVGVPLGVRACLRLPPGFGTATDASGQAGIRPLNPLGSQARLELGAGDFHLVAHSGR